MRFCAYKYCTCAQPFWISVAFFTVLRLFFCTYRKSINSPLGIPFDFSSAVSNVVIFNDKNAQFFSNIFRIFNATFNYLSNYYNDNKKSGEEFSSVRSTTNGIVLWNSRRMNSSRCRINSLYPALKGAWQDTMVEYNVGR